MKLLDSMNCYKGYEGEEECAQTAGAKLHKSMSMLSRLHDSSTSSLSMSSDDLPSVDNKRSFRLVRISSRRMKRRGSNDSRPSVGPQRSFRLLRANSKLFSRRVSNDGPKRLSSTAPPEHRSILRSKSDLQAPSSPAIKAKRRASCSGRVRFEEPMEAMEKTRPSKEIGVVGIVRIKRSDGGSRKLSEKGNLNTETVNKVKRLRCRRVPSKSLSENRLRAGSRIEAHMTSSGAPLPLCASIKLLASASMTPPRRNLPRFNSVLVGKELKSLQDAFDEYDKIITETASLDFAIESVKDVQAPETPRRPNLSFATPQPTSSGISDLLQGYADLEIASPTGWE